MDLKYFYIFYICLCISTRTNNFKHPVEKYVPLYFLSLSPSHFHQAMSRTPLPYVIIMRGSCASCCRLACVPRSDDPVLLLQPPVLSTCPAVSPWLGSHLVRRRGPTRELCHVPGAWAPGLSRSPLMEVSGLLLMRLARRLLGRQGRWCWCEFCCSSTLKPHQLLSLLFSFAE